MTRRAELVLPRDILARGNDWIAIDKPARLPSRPSPGHDSSVLAELERWLAEHEPSTPRPGVVHRLDRDTSGVLIFSLGTRRHRALVDAFRARRIRKEYWALVIGWPSPRRGTIALALSRNASGRTIVDSRGMTASTEYETVQRLAQHSILRVRPRTGRTHQIRVHLTARGTPVLGDRRYRLPAIASLRAHSATPGIQRASRLCLHAAHLILPPEVAGTELAINAPLPRDLARIASRVRSAQR